MKLFIKYQLANSIISYKRDYEDVLNIQIKERK